MIWRWAVLLLALAGTSACSVGTRLAYNNLDTLVGVEVGGYVDLDPAQKQLLKREFNSLWAWHRREELPAYSLALRSTADLAERTTLDRPAVDAIAETIRSAVQRIEARALPGLARLLASLDEAQTRELLAARQKEWDEELEPFDDETASESLQRLTDEFEERIENWIGKLTPEQRVYLARRMAEADARGEFADAKLKADAVEDQRAFAALLATRHEPAFADRIQALIFPQDAAALAELGVRRERGRSFFTTLAASFTPRQRSHFVKRLRSYADDASALALKTPTP